jgi:hypothetical protein
LKAFYSIGVFSVAVRNIVILIADTVVAARNLFFAAVVMIGISEPRIVVDMEHLHCMIYVQLVLA